jgi:CubicO group peptidase (beta-lactamase class C family)
MYGKLIYISSLHYCLSMSSLLQQVQGMVHEDWEPVQRAFEENFGLNTELGAQLYITREDRVVLDLSGMSRRQERNMTAASASASASGGDGSLYDANTLQNCYSSGKNMEAMCIAVLVDRGLLAYDDPMVKYWPEFGQHGKEHVTIADVLRHEGGVPFFSDPSDLTAYKRDRKVSAADVRSVTPLETLIESSGYWNLTGTRHYHACTRGWLLSGIIRRVDPKKRSLGQFMKEEISGPLGADIYCGIPPGEQGKFKFADVQNIPHAYAITREVLPAMLGFGDPALRGVIQTYKKKTSPVRRHGK